MSDPHQWISVCDAQGHELVCIRDVNELSDKVRQVLLNDLARREFVPVIERIEHPPLAIVAVPLLYETGHAADFDRVPGNGGSFCELVPLAIFMPPSGRPSASRIRMSSIVIGPRLRCGCVATSKPPPPAAPTGLTIDEVMPPEAIDFAIAVVKGFGMPEQLAPWLAAIVGREGWRAYVVRDRDMAVGGAAMFVSGRTAWLGIGAVQEGARRRGGQGALLARRIADVVQVVVLAPGADAFLGGRGAWGRPLLLAGEDVLELHHAGIGEQQRRVVARHERARGHHFVAVGAEIFEESGADIFEAGHGPILIAARRFSSNWPCAKR